MRHRAVPATPVSTLMTETACFSFFIHSVLTLLLHMGLMEMTHVIEISSSTREKIILFRQIFSQGSLDLGSMPLMPVVNLWWAP